MEAKKKRLRAWVCILLAVTVLLGACALTLTAVLAFRAFGTGGLLTRSETVVKTAHFSVNSGMMGYFFTEQINRYYEYYHKVLLIYASASSMRELESMTYQFMGIQDPEQPFKEQDFSGKTENGETVTVFDYYMGVTEEYVTRLLTLCEYAYAEDIGLTKEDLGEIAESVDEMERTYQRKKKAAMEADEPYPKTFGAYLQEQYGAVMTKQDVRECLELIRLAQKAQQRIDELCKQSLASRPESVERYALLYHADYYMADFYQYCCTVSDENMADEAFKAQKAALSAQARALAENTDMQDFERTVTELRIADEKKLYREKNWVKYLRENDYDEAKAQEALQAYYDETFTDAYKSVLFQSTLIAEYMPSNYEKDFDVVINETPNFSSSVVYPANKDPVNEVHAAKMYDWLFGTWENGYEDHAHPGDMTVVETTTVTQETNEFGSYEVQTYTVAVYRCAKEPYRDTRPAQQFGYAIFSDRAHAEQFYAEFCKGTMNKDTLYDLAKKMDGNSSLIGYDAVDDALISDLRSAWQVKCGENSFTGNLAGAYQWLENAKPGDCSGVLEAELRTPVGSAVYSSFETLSTPVYAVLIYDGSENEYWYTQALAGAAEEASEEWYEKCRLELTFNQDAYELIDK
ncbi:MAG: hypothetical protein IIW17_07895 [Clostridia bacterium]|nr:hypothetical protein [Clostridia bacterium]